MKIATEAAARWGLRYADMLEDYKKNIKEEKRIKELDTRLSSLFRNTLILLSSIKIGIFRIILINQSVTLIAIKKLEHRVITT